MKIKLLLFSFLLFSYGFANAQWSPNNSTFSYDFGTGTGTFSASGSAQNSTTFFPSPSSGTAYAVIPAAATNVSMVLNGDNTMSFVQPATTGGSGLAKYSQTIIANASDVVVHKFTLSTNIISTSGDFVYAIGNKNGSLFAGSGSVFRSSVELFAALRLSLSGADIKFQYRLGSNSSTITTWTDVNTTTFAKVGGPYAIEIYANNSGSSKTYTRSATSYTLPNNKYHVWVNGTQIEVSAGVVDFPRSIEESGTAALGSGTSIAMANGVNLDSYQFHASATYNDAANYKLSNISLTYNIAPLPVSLSSFIAKATNNGVVLNWKTVSEKNNNYFEILRSGDDKNFVKIAKVTGAGNRDQELNYTFVDAKPLSGNNYYLLNQINFDGTVKSYTNLVQSVNFGLSTSDVYASLADNKLSLKILSNANGLGNIKLYDTDGRLSVHKNINLMKGTNQLDEEINLPSGIYMLNVNVNGNYKTIKLLKN
ncbi:T9SS type A sorting domain-containing protein [Pedobacter sp. SD-b]|uniref:T9SS type A sorting domain-containing protein n=1 Tax=Pedobacter segetis TaxID=2793069 RepID=A0ABS1BMP3_9SPHI|nr:T9SS type A sorting domain-containing protein [Pedobacter segetis]MBK0384167.1 T9SS type A sorting domain-containing protein [Pedobacter segetis]